MPEKERHNYEYDVKLEGATAPARVIRMVGQDKKVLEIGAGPGSITKHLVEAGGCTVTALEIDEDAISKLSKYTNKIYPADLNDTAWPKLFAKEGLFEVVVAGDVLEHLYDPWNTLKLMKGLLTDDGYIVVSLPHVGHSAVVACLMDEDFHYQDWGLLDRTHIRFFGLKNMQSMFEDAGLAIEHAEFVVTRPEDTEFAEKWHKLPHHVRDALSENRFGSVYQVVIKARLDNRKGNKVDLLSLPVDVPASNIRSFLRRLVVSYLPSSVKSFLRKSLIKGKM